MGHKLFILVLTPAFICGIVFAVLFNQPHKNWLQSFMSHQHDTKEIIFDLWQAPLQQSNSAIFTLKSINGDSPLIIVNFWATWCPPCVKEMALLDKANTKGTVKIIGISYEDVETIRSFLKTNPVNYPITSTMPEDLDGLFQYIRGNGNATASLPFTILLNSNGEILRRRIGEFHSIDEVKEFATVSL